MPQPQKSKRSGANVSLADEIIAAMDALPRWEFTSRSHYVHSLVVPDLQRRKLLPPSYPVELKDGHEGKVFRVKKRR